VKWAAVLAFVVPPLGQNSHTFPYQMSVEICYWEDARIAEEDVIVDVEHHIGRFDISVSDPLSMQGSESIR
jgi:hypothetical protein